MIKIKLKKILASALICAMTLSSTAYAVEFNSIYDLKSTTRISSGVTYESIQKLTSMGWMNINVVRADLTDEYTTTGPLYNTNGTSIKTTLTNMMQQQNAIAGINGDFFIMDSPTQSYGPIISNGQLISSPYPYYENYPTISLSNNGSVDISVWNPNIKMTLSNGKTLNIPFVNKGASIKYNTVLLNKYYGQKTPGNTLGKDIVEIVIVNNKVTEIRENKAPITIPENGYVVACASESKNTIKNLFNVGDNIDLTFVFDFDINNLQWAVGGVNYLVKNGEINDIHSGILGRHPRTAVGFSKDNNEIIFVTVDGRNKNYIGATQTELAQIMLSLGAYNVVNLDGGGSTTMGVDFLKNGNIEVVNFPSDGNQRPIASGLGIFDNSPECNELEYLEITTEHDKIFNNTEVSLTANGLNKYYSAIDISDKEIVYSVDNSRGKIVDNKFIPSVPGVTTISAKIGDVTATTEITVLDTPVTLSFEDEILILDNGEQYTFKNIVGVDKDGNSAYISPNNIKWTYRNGIGKVENGVFTASDVSNTGAITAVCGDAVQNIIVKVGYLAQTIESFENMNNLSMSTYPENSNGSIEITSDKFIEQNNSLKLSYDFTNMTDQSIAFVELGNDGNGIKIENKPIAIGMWVYGDESNHWLRCRVQGSDGKIYKLDFAEEIDWNGWKWVTAKLPNDIKYPVTIKNVYIAEINETRKDTGTIYFDGLRALYETRDKNLRLREETVFVDSLKTNSLKTYERKAIVDGINVKAEAKEGTTTSKPLFMSVYIGNGTIDYSSTTAWNNLVSLTEKTGETIVLALNKSLNNINDDREYEVITEILEKTAQNNNLFVVWKGTSENTIIHNKVRYIEYDDIFEFYNTKDGVFYKN